MKTNLLLILSFLLTSQLRAADYYWVNGTGNWSDLNHWRLGSSAGPIPSTVPSSADNVFFGSYSGLGSSRTVTIDANAFCNNMTWESGIPSVTIFLGSDALVLSISGNLSLASTVSYNTVYITFTGGSPATLTSNGTAPNTMNIIINKPGSGLTLGDNLIYAAAHLTNTRNTINLTSGYFNAPGKTIKTWGFGSSSGNTRSLDISNATIEVSSFGYSASNKTLNAAGSYIKTTNISVDEGIYNIAEVGAVDNNNMAISITTFKKLTFTNTSVNSLARINTNNTVDSLIFLGPGSIRGSNNTVGYVRFDGPGQVNGGNNVIHYADAKSSFSITETANNVFDTLLTAPNKNVLITRTSTITQYFRAGGLPCDGFTEITGAIGGTLHFASGASASIDNVLLTNLAATGSITPITVNGIDNGGNSGFIINQPSIAGTTLYWVNGAGDWGDKTHWSTSSGGPGGACIPFINDNVVFDANSGFTAGNNTVTTTANTYCHNMTWAAGVGTAIFNESISFFMRVYGSVVLQSTVTANAIPEFTGTEASTITFNGGGAGTLVLTLNKTGAGSLTLNDNWTNTGADITHNSGGLNMAGRTISISGYDGFSALARSLDISNATITVDDLWDCRGTGKSLVSVGSHIICNGSFGSDAFSYPLVDITGAGGSFPISGTTIDRLTYTNSSTASAAGIGGGNNTVRRLEFKGKGTIVGGNNIDSLILAGSRIYNFSGTNTINKYFMAQSTTCNGLMEIKGTGTLAFAGAAEIYMSNIYMQNMTATGQNPTFNGADAGGNSGWTITSAAGSPRYWIGGSGDWNDPTHWSSTSGGASGACVPTVFDDVYFDAGSGFTAASKTVTINNGNAYCHNVNWTGAANNPIWSKLGVWDLECWGDSVILNSAATFSVSSLTLKGSHATYMKGNAPLGNFDFSIDKVGGSLIILTDYSNTESDFHLINGALNAAGRTLNVRTIDNLGSVNASSIDISNAMITAGRWTYNGTVTFHALNATNSVITTGSIFATGFTYNTVNVAGTADNHGTINNTIIDSLIFTNPSTTSQVGIGGANNVLNYVEYKGSGGIYGTGNTIDTLVFFPGNTYTLTTGTNTTITGEWYGNGTPCRLTEIVSSSTSSNATVTKTSGEVIFDYIRLRRITAAGAAQPFTAREHSIDLGNNVNWNISPYNGAAPIYGLGPDTVVYPGGFPIVLRTDGFFGAPSSVYTWNDNSHADTLLVSGPGTYSVSVDFPDGCSVSDQIIVTQGSTLPVTLTGFSAKAGDCQSLVSWEVTDAVNFSHFILERSNGGSGFTAIKQIAYTGLPSYSWVDKHTENQIIFYRLKMVDIDGRQTYSNTISITASCHGRLLQVYPTITENKVQVFLPPGYDRATIQLYNTLGQDMNAVVTGSGTVRTIELHSLPSAWYVLQVINGNEIKNCKIMKR